MPSFQQPRKLVQGQEEKKKENKRTRQERGNEMKKKQRKNQRGKRGKHKNN